MSELNLFINENISDDESKDKNCKEIDQLINLTSKIIINKKSKEKQIIEKPIIEKLIIEKQIIEKPIIEKLIIEKQIIEKPIIERSKKELIIKKEINIINISNIKTCKDNNIFDHFQSKINIKNLIYLYQSSNKECSRNGKLNPEVGSSRENDLKASFLSNQIFTVNYNIPNENEEDIVIDNKKISIKHSSDNTTTCSGIKIIWTVNKESREEFKKNFIFKCDLLIIYVRFNDRILLDKGELEIIYIPKETLLNQQNIFNTNKQNIFKFLDGNSRGVEFDKLFFKKIITESLFNTKIKFNNFECTISDPVIKRLNLIKQIN